MRRRCERTWAAAAGLAAAILICGTAVAAVTERQARDTASGYVPAGAAYQWTESDNGKYEVMFYDETRRERYEVKVSREEGRITGFESELAEHGGSREVRLSEEEASKAVTSEIEGAEILSVVLERDDGLMEYEVRFKADGYYGRYDVHPVSRAVLKRDIKVGTYRSVQDGVPDGALSPEEAAGKAEEAVPGCRVGDVDLDWEDGILVYEIEAYRDGVQYDIVLNASTGEVIKQKQEHYGDSRDERREGEKEGGSAPEAKISMEQARDIALKKVPGAVLSDIELDYDDGRPVYEGELYKGGWEYEFKIDASSGEIIKWDQEYDD